jgi:hypothetical protein
LKTEGSYAKGYGFAFSPMIIKRRTRLGLRQCRSGCLVLR